MNAPGRFGQQYNNDDQDDYRDRRIEKIKPAWTVAVFHNSQYTKFMDLFHEKTKKAVGMGFIVVSILVIISMILLYFPVWR